MESRLLNVIFNKYGLSDLSEEEWKLVKEIDDVLLEVDLAELLKVLDVKLNGDVLKISFSNELNNISEEQSSKMIESLVYTLTEFEEVLGTEIYVEDNLLSYIPNTLNSLPTLLTRDFGINKVYDLNIKDISFEISYLN